MNMPRLLILPSAGWKQKTVQNNPQKAERDTLLDLKDDHTVVVWPAGKGGAMETMTWRFTGN